jgi:hypothetical protein
MVAGRRGFSQSTQLSTVNMHTRPPGGALAAASIPAVAGQSAAAAFRRGDTSVSSSVSLHREACPHPHTQLRKTLTLFSAPPVRDPDRPLHYCRWPRWPAVRGKEDRRCRSCFRSCRLLSQNNSDLCCGIFFFLFCYYPYSTRWRLWEES